MPITEEQRIQRRHHVGSSDAAAILGVDQFRTAYDVWAEKTGRLPDRAPTAVMEAGSLLEGAVLDWAEGQLGILDRNVSLILEGTPLAANVDAVTEEAFEPVEAKTAGGSQRSQWGDEGTDQVPDRIIIQAHVHMLVTEAHVCHVPVLFGGSALEFAMYQVPLNNDLARLIVERCADWWDRFVVADTPPTDSAPSLAVVKYLRRQMGKSVGVALDIVTTCQQARAAARAAQEEKEVAEAALLAALGDAEIGEYPCGQVTYLEQKRAAYEVKASTYRVLRIREHKGEGA